ncbi:MAG: hypothetical protein U0133_05815 [Gemmatimonadales bacterium]
MNQRLDRLKGLLVNPPALLSLMIAAAGITLAAEGLRNWRTYAIRRESSESLSPIAYHGTFGSWSGVTGRFEAQRPWYLILTGLTPAEICGRLGTAWQGWSGGGKVAVLDLRGQNEGPAQLTQCQVGESVVPVISASSEDVSSSATELLPNGFVLTDDDFTVVYGSGAMRDLHRVPRITSLLQARTGL